MRIASLLSLVFALACAKAVTFGPLDGGSPNYPSITAVDSAHPPKSVSVKLDNDAYVAVLLVAPGHSATLLFPADSTTDNKRSGGSHEIAFAIPTTLVRVDSARSAVNESTRQRFDSVNRTRTRTRPTGIALPPLLPTTPAFLLVITSPQQLSFARIREKTAGVSIPLGEIEAINAIGKAVKSTIQQEPRAYAGYWQKVTLIEAK